MFRSSNTLSETSRATLARELNACLVDGLDLKSQIKVAHWNVKGPQFAALHPLFESFAVALGALAVGTAKQVAKTSRIPDYPAATTAGLEHVALLADRFDVFLASLR